MRVTKIKNLSKDISREDEVTIVRTIKGKRISFKLKVYSVNGEIDQWDAATRKDETMLSKIRRIDGAGWDMNILDILKKSWNT